MVSDHIAGAEQFVKIAVRYAELRFELRLARAIIVRYFFCPEGEEEARYAFTNPAHTHHANAYVGQRGASDKVCFPGTAKFHHAAEHHQHERNGELSNGKRGVTGGVRSEE